MLIQKCSYIKPGKGAERYLHYVSTRDGVEVLHKPGPATAQQVKLIQQLLSDFPDSEKFSEYEDYLQAQTLTNASAVISAILDHNIQNMSDASGYLRYISLRPGAERKGAHGLFQQTGIANLNAVSEELKSHKGPVWTIIYSLNQEDAERLGYDHADSWQSLIASSQNELAKTMRISLKDFRWCAAFHHPETHPHVHLMLWSTDPKRGYVTHDGLEAMRSKLTTKIYQDELLSLYQEKDQSYKTLIVETKSKLQKLTGQLINGVCESPIVAEKLLLLSDAMKDYAGKKVYGYFPKKLKAMVDDVVDELAKVPEVAAAYEAWNQLKGQQERYYQNEPRVHLALSQQKEFRAIKNAVIREANDLCSPVPTFEDAEMVNNADTDGDTADEGLYFAQGHKRQSAQYRSAEKTLLDSDASIAEQQTAIDKLEQLWNDGYTVAAHLLGKCYRDGLGTPVDTTLAIRWFRKSAEAGNSFSQYAIAKILLKSSHIQDAIPWLCEAAKQGNQYAKYQLGKFYLAGEVVPKDVAFGVRCWKDAASQGNVFAQYALGRLYLTGNEVRQDQSEAIHWLSMSVNQGHYYAQFMLDHMNGTCNSSAILAATRLFHHLGKILQDTPIATNPTLHIDSKRRRQLQEKRLALGHHESDHEEQENVIKPQ